MIRYVRYTVGPVTSYKWGYNPYKWPKNKWVYNGFINLLIGVFSPHSYLSGCNPLLIIFLRNMIIQAAHLLAHHDSHHPVFSCFPPLRHLIQKKIQHHQQQPILPTNQPTYITPISYATTPCIFRSLQSFRTPKSTTTFRPVVPRWFPTHGFRTSNFSVPRSSEAGNNAQNLGDSTGWNLEDGLPGPGYVVNNRGDRKSPSWGCPPSKWPKWLINGGY